MNILGWKSNSLIAAVCVYNGIMATSASEEQTRTTAVSEVLRRLEACYGRPAWEIAHPPLDELILTILSQHTSDANCEHAFASLRARFPDWEQVRLASDEEIVDAIRMGGLASVKAPRIKMVVSQVLATNALDDLDSLSLADAKSLLQSLPGVGPKTAACVLLFACHRPALPVDTHVYRVSHRIGLIDAEVNAESAHDILESLLEDHDVYSFHVNMIKHGRAVCRSRSPRCSECSLADLCRFALQGVGAVAR
jgi:endonuclease III